jgi:hypothetical protein
MPNTLLTLTIALAIHITWFNSNFPAHVFGVLRKLGLGKTSPGYWSDSGDETRYFDDWFTWANLTLPEYWAELLTCPICLSWHIGFWVNLSLCLLGQTFEPTVFIGNIAAGVVLAHIINKGLHND